jgi:hypothetical protein
MRCSEQLRMSRQLLPPAWTFFAGASFFGRSSPSPLLYQQSFPAPPSLSFVVSPTQNTNRHADTMENLIGFDWNFQRILFGCMAHHGGPGFPAHLGGTCG